MADSQFDLSGLLTQARPPRRRGRHPNATKNNAAYRQRLRERPVIEHPAEKQCWACKKIKPAAEFNRLRSEPDGLKRVCGPCQGFEHAARKARPGNAVETKECSRCGRTLPAAAFSARADSADKLATHCTECEAARFLPWYVLNSQSVIDAAKNWAVANPEMARATRQMTKQRRRIVEESAGPNVSASEWRRVVDYFGHRCAYCLEHEGECGKLTVEHILPVSRDGTNDIDNLVPACLSCNCSKRDKTILEYASWLSVSAGILRAA